jgi:hypothetical protein
MRSLGFLPLLLLSNCASFESAYEPPVVDLRGVAQNKYAYDLGECTEQKKNAGPITFGAPISSCMEAKGYKVLIRKS